MHRLAAFVLAAVLALAPAALAQAADPPLADTGAAKDVGQTQATLTAKVNPRGSATSVRFDLGTTTSYGLQSAAKDAGSGTTEVTVEIPVQGLTPATTYHFRVVATSTAGTAEGADATFTTASVPARPTVSTGGVRDVTTTAATLTGSVNPRSSATGYRFEYGLTTTYGASTPTTDVGAGTRSVAASARIGDLQPGKRYHYRLVASNGLGTTRGGDRSFVAAAHPTSATLTASADPAIYGQGVTLSGKLGGPKVSGVRVRLQLTPFPFTSPFADAGNPVVSSSSGAFSFTLPSVTLTTRALVIADGVPPVISKVVVVRSAARVGILSIRRSAGRVVVRGRVTPATPQGVAALQRQGRNGSWVPMGRTRVAGDGTYEISFRARRAALTLRVVGLTHDGGGHVRGISRERRVAGTR
jgi:hypothetical protein